AEQGGPRIEGEGRPVRRDPGGEAPEHAEVEAVVPPGARGRPPAGTGRSGASRRRCRDRGWERRSGGRGRIRGDRTEERPVEPVGLGGGGRRSLVAGDGGSVQECVSMRIVPGGVSHRAAGGEERGPT